MKIFLLEDDPIFQRIIKADLEDEGHEVTVWGCVNGAVELIKEGGLELLVVDIILPLEESAAGNECVDGGIRVIESLIGEGIRLPTIYMSVMEGERFRSRIEALKLIHLEDEVTRYFMKPYDRQEFLDALRKVERLQEK
ncbi:MAG: response regulator [Pseudomonadota bacterium]